MNAIRNGNFTSSEIVALTTLATDKKSFGKPALTYIKETNMERKLGRALESESNARPLSWGKLVERRIFDLMGLECVLCSTETKLHPEIDFWVGSADGIKYDEGKTIIDFKCPITLKSFCQISDCKTIEEFRNSDHKDAEKFYWQLVSNAIINDCKYAELICYAPFQNELDAIREMAGNIDDPNPFQYLWISHAADNELPYLIEGGFYKNIHVIRFEISQADKAFLTERVKAAGAMLQKF